MQIKLQLPKNLISWVISLSLMALVFIWWFPTEKQKFNRNTGLHLPFDATIVESQDDYPFSLNGDGASYYIAQLDSQAVSKLLSGKAPLGPWMKGPYPAYNSADLEEVLTYPLSDPSRYRFIVRKFTGFPVSFTRDFPGLLASENIYFSASERCCANSPWRNGDIVIIDTSTNRVYYYRYDT